MLTVLYEDNHLLAVVKPVGLPTMGVAAGKPSLITLAKEYVKEKYDKLIAEGISPTRRWGEPEDIARVATSLASGNFHFSTGDAYHVDGGLLIHRL